MAQRKFSVDSQLSVLDNRYISRRASLAYSATPELPEPTAGMTPTGMKTRWKRAFFNLKKTGNLKHKESMERIPQDYAGGGSDSKIKTSNGQKSPRMRSRNIFRTDQSTSDLNTAGLKLSASNESKIAIGNGSPLDVDPVYLLLKQGAILNTGKQRGADGTDSGFGSDRRLSKASNETLAGSSSTSTSKRMMDRRNSSMSEPESGVAVPSIRPMLNARMKSVSLDSSEQPELIQGRVGKAVLEHRNSTVGPLPGGSSPSARRRILQSTKGRVKSLDLGDGHDRHPEIPTGKLRSSSASEAIPPCHYSRKGWSIMISQCESAALKSTTVPNIQIDLAFKPEKAERVPPPNVFVALQSYRCKGPDELDLRPGDMVIVVDSSQPDWWKGKCFSATGYFPKECVARVNPGERVCVVTHALQLNENGTMLRLSKDDIVMTTGPDEAGMVPIRCGGKRACCPLKYLQVLDYFES